MTAAPASWSAAAVASLEIFEREPVMERIADMEAFYEARLPAFLSHPPHPPSTTPLLHVGFSSQHGN